MTCPPWRRKSQRLAAYRRIREKYRETVEDQLALAGWCKKAGLHDQWRAHLGNVLALNPDHQEARGLLGYQRVNGIWLTPQEIAAGQRAGGGSHRGPEASGSRNCWPSATACRIATPIAGRWRGSGWLRSRTPRRSLHWNLCSVAIREPMALVGVNKFAEMSVADASLALARQALFSPWPAVRKAAVEKLKTRNRETYVPVLLSAMASPTQSRIELFQEPGGRLLYRHAFYRPGQDRDELAVFDTMYDNNSLCPFLHRYPPRQRPAL